MKSSRIQTIPQALAPSFHVALPLLNLRQKILNMKINVATVKVKRFQGTTQSRQSLTWTDYRHFPLENFKNLYTVDISEISSNGKRQDLHFELTLFTVVPIYLFLKEMQWNKAAEYTIDICEHWTEQHKIWKRCILFYVSSMTQRNFHKV